MIVYYCLFKANIFCIILYKQTPSSCYLNLHILHSLCENLATININCGGLFIHVVNPSCYMWDFLIILLHNISGISTIVFFNIVFFKWHNKLHRVGGSRTKLGFTGEVLMGKYVEGKTTRREIIVRKHPNNRSFTTRIFFFLPHFLGGILLIAFLFPHFFLTW